MQQLGGVAAKAHVQYMSPCRCDRIRSTSLADTCGAAYSCSVLDNSITSLLNIRTHPRDAGVPMLWFSGVPWIVIYTCGGPVGSGHKNAIGFTTRFNRLRTKQPGNCVSHDERLPTPETQR